MSAKVGYLVIDSVDPHGLAPFWCGLLDVSVDATIGDGEFLVLSSAADGLTVGFQHVPEAKEGKNVCTSTWWWTTSTLPLPKSSSWAAIGWNRD
jgi:hypothetical protein